MNPVFIQIDETEQRDSFPGVYDYQPAQKDCTLQFLFDEYNDLIKKIGVLKAKTNIALNTLPVDIRPVWPLRGLESIVTIARKQRAQLNEFCQKERQPSTYQVTIHTDTHEDEQTQTTSDAPDDHYIIRTIHPFMQEFIDTHVSRLITPYTPQVKNEKKQMRNWLWQVVQHYDNHITKVNACLANAAVEILSFTENSYSRRSPNFDNTLFLGKRPDQWTCDFKTGTDNSLFLHTMIRAYLRKVGAIGA